MKKEQPQYSIEVVGAIDIGLIPKDLWQNFCLGMEQMLVEIVKEENDCQ